jgi:hypothetical protein
MLNFFIRINQLIMNKKIVYLLLSINILLSGCSSTMEGFSLKKKSNSGNEFLVKKKDPLILPPNFQKLPTPDNQVLNEEEITFKIKNISKKEKQNSGESNSSIESTILKKISD